MTNDEAIEILQSGAGIWPITDRANNALNKAIKALEQELCEDANANRHNSNVLNDVGQHKNALEEDAISRRAMLDGLASIAKAKAKSDAQKSLMGRVMFFTERLPSVNPQEQKWIPVSEGLPDERKSVLVWCPEYRNMYCAYLENKSWWIFGAFSQIIPNAVIAWMPLPEPYKAESEVSE